MNGYLLAISAALIWSIGSGLLVKSTKVPAVALYPIAALVGTIVVLFFLFKKGKVGKIFSFRGKTLLLLLGVGVGVSFNNGLFFSAVQSTTVANALLTHNLMPLVMVFFFGPFFLKEKINKITYLAVLLGIGGLILILWPQLIQSKVETGVILGVSSSLFYALHTVFERKLGVLKVDSEVAVIYKNVIPALAMMPFALFYFSNNPIMFDDIWKIGLFGLLSLGLGFILFFMALSRIPASHASILTYLEPIGAILLAAIFLREGLAINTILGGILIILAGILVTMRGRKV